MSNFKITAEHKSSGEIHEVWCLDDYFGRHLYGYIPITDKEQALTESEFYAAYTPKETK